MASHIHVPDELRCARTKPDGSRCSVARVGDGKLCMFHMPKSRQPDGAVVPSEPLNELVHLDPTVPQNLQRLRLGLLQHVAAGTIEHQAATACLRFAQAAYDAQPHKVKETALGGMMARLMSTEPKPVDG